SAAVLTVTEAAAERILELRGNEEDPSSLALRIEVTGQQGVEYAYDLSFAPLDETEAGDAVFDQRGLPVVVPAASADAVRGATLDIPAPEGRGGLVLRIPSRPDPVGVGDLELTSTPSERITTLLDQRINPALAAHG